MATFKRFQQIGGYLRPYWRPVAGGIIALFLSNALGVYLPRLIGESIDNLRSDYTYQTLWTTVLIISVLASGVWAVRMFSRLAIFGVGRSIEFDLKQQLFQHLLRLEPSYFASQSSGDLISRSTNDIDNVRRLVGFALLSLVNTIFAYGLSLPIMIGIDGPLTIFAVAVYPFMLGMVQLFSGRLQEQQLQVQERLSDLSQLVQEDVSGMSLIKIYAQENNEQAAFEHSNRRLLFANLKLARTRNFLFPLIEGLSYVSLLVLLWQGSDAIAGSRITVGDFVTLLLLVERLVFPTALLGFTITAYQRGEVSLDRVESILRVEPKIKDPSDPKSLTNRCGTLTVKDLSYTYADTKKPALDQVNFEIPSGATVAIVGPMGCGKSTLANALTRLLDVESEHIFLDDQDITQLTLQDLRRAIAYVPQESFLFSDTIEDNIRFGEPRAEHDLTVGAAKDAQIHPEILNFPKQYQTLVGERGITLSGGQRQRSALARALLIESPTLILDDALSSVDNQTATEILESLSQGRQQRTTLFITHQLSAAALADRILVMDKGRVVQQGTHEELIARPGCYQDLWQQHQLEEILQ
ncbi:MAG: ABC transporter ATP-binding protein [Cyanobacteria bacterium P01_H01_bin.15]